MFPDWECYVPTVGMSCSQAGNSSSAQWKSWILNHVKDNITPSSFYCYSSHICTEYPKNLALSATICNFAASNIKNNDEKRNKDCAVERTGTGDSRRCVGVDGVWGVD